MSMPINEDIEVVNTLQKTSEQIELQKKIAFEKMFNTVTNKILAKTKKQLSARRKTKRSNASRKKNRK